MTMTNRVGRIGTVYSLYAIGPCPFVTCDVTWSVPVYIDKVHSLYSLVLISQDFLFSCLPLCDASSG
jgi:hypothetical protein